MVIFIIFLASFLYRGSFGINTGACILLLIILELASNNKNLIFEQNIVCSGKNKAVLIVMLRQVFCCLTPRCRCMRCHGK